MIEAETNKIKELFKVFQSYMNKKILIVLRGAPDPDSISSALAHKAILKSWGIEATILYVEEVSHQENRALLKLLGIELVQYSPGFQVTEYQGLSLVDSQRPDIALVEQLKALPVISIVDHHEPLTQLKAEFVDIRKTVSATATIYAEYLKYLEFFESLSDEQVAIATALLHGIRVDTDNLILAQESDYESCIFLARYADKELLKKISLQKLSPNTMDTIFQAYQNKTIYENFLLAAAGIVRKEDRDAIPQAADFFLKRAGIDTVMVYGIVGEHIDCSLRTSSDVVHPEKFIQDVFPDVLTGEFGGSLHKGGFRLPLGIFKSLLTGDDRLVLSQIVDRYVMKHMAFKFGTEKS